MSFVADWDRPSTLLLAAVLAANLVMPLVHFWPGQAGAAETPAAQPARAAPAQPDGAVQTPPARSAPPTRSAQPARATRAPAAGAVRIEPIAPTVPAERVALQKPAPVCRAWGPFAELTQAQSVAARLRLDDGDFEVLETEVQVRSDFLVKVRTAGSRDATERAISELRSHDVDSYVLERSRLGSVLAAGVFSRQARAESLRRRLAGLGYQVEVEELSRSRQAYHLLARVPANLAAEIPPAGACSDIAPMEQFL